eukprot:XP_011408021.1 PREDICTED: uncharacterized protein LOC105315174 [Amphimedon queenslandica]
MPFSEPLPDCYEGDPDLLPLDEAMRRIRVHVEGLKESRRLPLIEAGNKIAANDITSPIDVPGHTNSAMDGYAVDGNSLVQDAVRSFEPIGEALAGHPFAGTVEPHQTVRITTGAMMPAGTDTVVMQEHIRVENEGVVIPPGNRKGQHVRRRGEDIKAGAVVIECGRRLMPAQMGLLASLGIAEVEVFRPLKVAYFSTGDEIRSPGEDFAPGLVYDSNRFTMRSMLERLGVEIIDLGIVPDRRDAVEKAFEKAAKEADVVLSSGGASTGEADHIKEALSALGRVGFWRIAIRPGRPLAFGFIGDALCFGLPGNPVAVMVTFLQIVAPALRAAAGESAYRPPPEMEARCTVALRKKPGRIEYYRAVLERDENDALVVRDTGRSGSGLLHTMSDANCFIVLPEASESIPPGSMVRVQPFFGLI